MARRILISRRDWLQDPAASLAGGVWQPGLPLVNLIDHRPQLVAEAVTNLDWGSTQFTVDLGYARIVGLFFFAQLRATSLGIMRLRAGNDPAFVTNTYDTDWTTCWPPDGSTPFEANPWGELALTHVYMPDEYEKLGYPRILVPAAPISCRYIKVEFIDPTSSTPLQIGCFGACEVWEPAEDRLAPGWEWTAIDESDVSRVPGGSTYFTERMTRRRLNLGFTVLPEAEVRSKVLGLVLIKGRSKPLVVVMFPDDTYNLEKEAIYGTISRDSPISNPFFALRSFSSQIDQL